MGCISSKHVAKSTISPLHHHSSSLTLNHNHNHLNYGLLDKIKDEKEHDNKIINNDEDHINNVVESLNHHSNNKQSKKPSFTFGVKFGRSTVAEHVAAGWPAWLSAVAGEAIDGWLPQKSDSYERFEKVDHSFYVEYNIL